MNDENRSEIRFLLLLRVLAFAAVFNSAYAFAAMQQDTIVSMQHDMTQILALIEQQKTEQAYQQAVDKSSEYEGIIEFDYVFGLAAQANKHYHQAIFAFERVVKQSPNWLLPRYALATSYFSAGNIQAAKIEFEQIKSATQNDEFPNIDKYLTAIANISAQANGQWQHQIDLGFGYDSNANSGIDDEVINIPLLGQVTLFDSSQALDDQFLQVQMQSSYLKPLNLNSNWYGIAKLRYADYQDNSALSRTFADVFIGYQQKLRQNTFHINGFYRPLWLGSSWSVDNKYLDYYGVTGSVSHALKKNHQLGIDASYAQLAYQQADLDRDQVFASFWYQFEVKQFSSRVSFSYGQESADLKQFKHLGRDFIGASYRLTAHVTKTSLLSAQFDYVRSDYQAQHPLFSQQRVDSMLKASINYQQYFMSQWSWMLKVVYIDNRSDLSLYDYQRGIVSTAIRYQF